MQQLKSFIGTVGCEHIELTRLEHQLALDTRVDRVSSGAAQYAG